MDSASLPEQNSTLYTVTPNQLQQAIENSVAAMIWIGKCWHGLIWSTIHATILLGGKLGPYQGGFEWAVGESQVTQVITEWRLNVSVVTIWEKVHCWCYGFNRSIKFQWASYLFECRPRSHFCLGYIHFSSVADIVRYGRLVYWSSLKSYAASCICHRY